MQVQEALELIGTVECFPGWTIMANTTSLDYLEVTISYHTVDSDTLEVQHFITEPEKVFVGDVDEEGFLRRVIAVLISVRVHEEREFFRAMIDGEFVKLFDPHSEAGNENWVRTAYILS
jgi:hypothetical protein